MAATNVSDCGEFDELVATVNPIEVLLEENRTLKNSCALMQQQMAEMQNEILKLRSFINADYDDNFNTQPRKIPRSNTSVNTDRDNVTNVTPSSSKNNNNSNINISNSGTSNSFSSVISNNNNNLNNNNFTVVKRKKKILQAVDVDLRNLNNHLKNNKCVNYTIKQSSRNAPVKISITDEKEIPVIKNHLSQAKVSFHEYMWDHEKKKAFIIKGLVGATADDVPFIKSQLVLAGLPEKISVSIFESGFMRSNPNLAHNSLIQMVLPPNADTKLVSGIKYLDHVAIKIEPLKKSKVLQCKNCQRFGHSAGGCQHVHRCVKCSANHYRDDCPRTTDKSMKLKCCNCGGEHTANNIKDCPFAQQFISNANKGINISNINNNSNNRVQIESTASSSKLMSSNINKIYNSPSIHNGNSGSKKVRFSNNSNNLSYAQVLEGGTSIGVITKKLDFLINIVLKHEQLFAKINNDE